MDTPTSMVPVVPPVAIEPPPVMAHVETARGCITCSYSLQGLPLSGACPECGTPVQHSLRGILLQFAGADYLASVRSGLSLVLNGILLQIIVMIGSIGVAFALGAGRAGGRVMTYVGLQVALTAVALIPAIMIILGYWRYTMPDPAYVGTENPKSARSVLRIAVLVGAGVQAFQLLVQGATWAGVLNAAGGAAMLVGALSFVLGLVSLAASAVQFFACMRYTNWMGRRIPDAFVDRRSRTYMWLLPVLATVGALVLVGPLVALVLYWNLLDRMRKHLKAIQATGEPAALKGALG